MEFSQDGEVNSEEQLVYLVSNILFTIFWRGVPNDHIDCWKERGQVLGCINLLALNNELMTSHLSLRLKILEMAVQASLSDLAQHGSQVLINQEVCSFFFYFHRWFFFSLPSFSYRMPHIFYVWFMI